MSTPKLLIRASLCVALLAPLAAVAADVGVSINLGEPGFYGRLDLGGGVPQPELVYPSPIVVQRGPDRLGPPVYLHVRPGYERNWKHHCREYNACGVPVFFVRDTWYNRVYVEHYRNRGQLHDDHRGHDEHHDENRGPGHEHDHDHDR